MSQNPFDFKGRIPARTYAMSLAILVIFGTCIGLYAGLESRNGQLHDAVVILAGLALNFFGAVQAAKRARDTGWSGWWALVTLIPIAQFIAWGVFLFVRSDLGENRYGPAAGAEIPWVKACRWILVSVASLLILAAGVLLMVLPGALSHMNGR